MWAQLNRDQVVNFMFGLRFQAMYLPLVMVLLDVAMGQFDPMMLFGMAAGHVWYFLAVVYPQQPHTQGKRPLQTPEFMYLHLCYFLLLLLVGLFIAG